MAKLRLATDRSGSGVLASDQQSRDIQIQSYSLSFHGRLLIENADFSLNYGQRYASDCAPSTFAGAGAHFGLRPQIRSPRRERIRQGALASSRLQALPQGPRANLSRVAQTTWLESMAARDVEIPDHIDVRHPRRSRLNPSHALSLIFLRVFRSTSSKERSSRRT